MHESLLTDIGLSIITAALFAIPTYFLKLPFILAFILAGITLGPQLGFGFIKDHQSITQISEIGLVLLLFILGLEMNIKKLFQAGKAVFYTSICQILCSLGFTIVILAFQLGIKTNLDILYIAVACCLSSTLIVVKILSDQMDLDSLPSRITLGILIIQDLFVIGFLAIQPHIHDLQFFTLITSFSKILILTFVSYLFSRWILPTIFRTTSRQPELMLLTAMSWCFGLCGFAYWLNLSLEMGALMAGISIASYPYHLDVIAKISSLRDFFITLFFVSLGLQIQMPNFNIIMMTLILILLLYFTRFVSIFPMLYRLGYGLRVGTLTSLNLSQLSEFAIVIASIGFSMGHIQQETLSIMILTTVVTALISSVVIPRSHHFFLTLKSIFEYFGIKDSLHPDGVDNRDVTNSSPQKYDIVLLGFYRDASSFIDNLLKRTTNESEKKNILVVDFNPEVHQKLNQLGVSCIYGDISHVDTLSHLKLEDSRFIICTLTDKILKGTTNLQLLRNLKRLAPDSCIIVTAENISLAKELYQQGAHYVYCPRLIGAHYLIDVVDRLKAHGAESILNDALAYLDKRKEIVN